jgi:putative DNA primase/helicase
MNERPTLDQAVEIRPAPILARANTAPADLEAACDAKDDRAPEFSDEALALRFAERHAADLRYVAAWGKWLVWDGVRWGFDDTLYAVALARLICREAAATCNNAKAAAAIASAKTVAAVERLARADRGLAATTGQWDADPWRLNTTAGVVDLQTAKLRPHRTEDHMTKVTAIGALGDCPRFLEFLDRITAGDSEMVSYLQRVFGYCLSGQTTEHALFFAYGTGANGKSVLLSTIAGILGDYARTAPIEAFVASGVDRHPTELAGLRGARLVSATETEEGRRWAEARIKQLTGGDMISARFMRQDFFEYRPAFKLFIAGNHKPSLRSVDEAIRRRFHLIPFVVTIPPAERDPELFERLKDEWPGILAWMIEGAREWQAEGLRPPKAVLDATDAYLAAEDSLAAWIDDCCERDGEAWASSGELFGSWCRWATKAGEFVGSAKRFGQRLESHGISPERRRHGRGYVGLRLARAEAFADEGDAA